MSDFDPDEFIRKYGGAPTEEEEEAPPVVAPILEPEAEEEPAETLVQPEPEAAAEFDPDEFVKKYGGAPKREAVGGEDYLARQAQYLMSRPPLDEEVMAEPEVEGDGIIRQALDIPINIKVGAVRGVKFMTDIFGADNPVSNALKSYESIFTDLLSAESRQDQETIARIMQEAEDEGILGQIAAGLQAFTVAPLDMTAQAAGTMIPILAAGLVGKVARLGATGVRALQAGAGGGMGVGVVKSEIYDGVYEYMLSKGVDEEEARRTASQAQAYNGKNLDSILIGGGLGIVAASTGAERIVSAIMMKAGGRPTGNLVQRVFKAGFTEAAPESAQGFQEKLAQNLALQREGADVDLGRGVFANAALEGVAGFTVGGPLGVFKAPMTPQEVAGLAKETQQAASDAKDVAPATADTVEKLADTISVDATVGPLARREDETDEQYRARIDQVATETPDERVARLQREAQEAAGDIELEEEPPVSGLPPQPVTPTPEAPPVAPVAPVEPAPIVTEETPPPAPEAPAEAAAPPQPTVAGFTTARGSTYEVTPEGKTVRTKRSEGRGQGETYEPHSVLFVPNETNLSILSDMQGGMGDYSIRMGYSQGDRFIQVTDTNQIPADVTPQIAIVSRSSKQIIPNGVYDAQRNPEVGFNPVEKLYKTDGTSSTHLGNQITEIRPTPEAAPVTPTPTEVAPTDVAAKEYINPAQLAAQKETVFGTVDPQRQAVDATGQIIPRYMWHSPPSGLRRESGVAAYVSREAGAQRSINTGFAQADRLRDVTPETGRDIKTVWLGRFGRDKGMREGAFTIDLAKLDPANILITGQAEGNVWYRGDIPESAIDRSGIDPTPTLEPPALAPLRRVVKAEQTEDDVSGLVGQGLVELYNGQPVITQAGLEALPEAERPRLTPEARKIQIDTRTSEAAAEAISKNLRIGVDQVPVDVRMPAGWTLVGDVYVPPTVEAAPEAVRPEVAKPVAPKARKMKEPATMTAGEVNKEMDRLRAESSQITQEFIAAGRGNERPSEYLEKTDPLSVRAKENADRMQAVRDEVRLRYGTDVSTLPTGRRFGPRARPEPETPPPTTKEGEKKAEEILNKQVKQPSKVVSPVVPIKTTTPPVTTPPQAQLLPSDQADKADAVLAVSKKNNYYTLWFVRQFVDGKPVKNSFQYLTILSTDPDEAVRKADAYGADIVGGKSLSVAFAGKNLQNLQGAKTIAILPEFVEWDQLSSPLRGAAAGPIGQQTVGFGKYSGVKVDDLYAKDSNYVDWLMSTNPSSKRVRDIVDYLRTSSPELQLMADARELEGARIRAYEERESRRKGNEQVPVTTLVRREGQIVEEAVEQVAPKPKAPKLKDRKAKDQMVDIVAPRTNLPDRVASNLKPQMYPIQVDGANAVIESMDRFNVALNGDGAGVGKTRQIIAVAEHYAKQGKPVVIVTENAAIGKPWEGRKTPILGGSMAKDSEAMGVTLNLLTETDKPADSGAISITTYNRVTTQNIPTGAIVIFDESQNLANTFGAMPDERAGTELGQWQIKFRDIFGRAERTAFYSATPADKPHQLAYLYKVLGFNSPEEYLSNAVQNGTVIKTRRFGSIEQQYYDVPSGKNRKATLYKWVNGIMTEAGNIGRFIKREISYEGTDVQFHDVKGTDQEKNPWAKPFLDALAQMASFQAQGYLLLAPNSYVLYAAELTKIGDAVRIAKRELDAGRKIVIYFSRINDLKIRGRKSTMGMDGRMELGEPVDLGIIPSPVVLLRDELKKEGIKFTELHGKSGTTSQKAQKDFAGPTNVLLASVESGGTGINLDDTTGNEPRTEIFMFSPYRGISTIQAMGRIWRASTIQDDNKPNRFVFATASDIDADASRSAVLAKKLQLMNASLGGTAVSRLPMSKTSYDPSQLVGIELPEEGVESAALAERTGVLMPVSIKWSPTRKGGFYAKATADLLEWVERGGADRTGINVSVFKSRDSGDWVALADKEYKPEDFVEKPEPPSPQPEARGTVAGIVGEPTVRAYENQQSQNRSRLEKEVAAVPAPAWGTTQDQKRNSIVGFRDQWVGRWNNVLGRAGLSVRVDQRPVDEAGNRWKGTSRVQIQPDGQLSVVVGRGTEELALRQGDQEVPAKQRVALDVEEEVVHAIYLSQVLAGWDKQGDPVDYANRVLNEKTQKIRATVGDNVFRTLVNDTLRSYYKEILSPDLIGVLTQRVIDGNEAESFTFLNELARMVAQKNVRGITQEEVYYSVVEQVGQWVRELLNSIRQFTTNYNLLGTEFAADMDGLIKEYQALADVLATPEARESRREPAVPRQRFQQGEADIRYNPLGYDITNVVEDIKAGRTDGPLRAVNNVVKEATALRDRVKAEAERRQRPRARGKAAILERIARERSGGKLSEETAQALTDFVNSIREEAIGDTAISIKGAGGASNFDFGQSLVNFFLTQDQPKVGARVGIHEFWHGLSRFLPKPEAEKMASDYTKALGEYLKKNPWFLAFVGRYSLTPEQFEEYKLFNPKEAETKLVPVQDSQGNIVKYQIKYDAENYRYIMLDEWIAEKMTDLVEGRQAMPNTFMGKLAKIIKEFLAQIQAKLGRDPYQAFYNLVTDPNQKIDLQRMSGVARPFQIYQPQDYNYAEDISDQIRYATIGAEPEPQPSFAIDTPEAKTLSNLKASMEKADSASEAKGGRPATQKISEIAANWMEQGGDERALQDAITENTNLSPANAAKVAKVIARQYDKQQQIAEAVLETEAGAALEGVPEGMEIPKDVDPKNKRTVLQRVIDATTGVRVKPVILQVPEKTALKEQIRLKARETREAKKAQQETADAVVEAIKALELRGPMRAKQAQALAKRAAKVIWTSDKSLENFIAYAERVMANTNYDADLREAKAAQKRAKELSKRDSIAAPQRFVLEAIGNVGINLLNDPREFADVVNHYLRSFKPVVSEAYVVVPDAEMESYLSMAEDEVVSAKAEFDVEDNEKLAEKYGVSVNDLQRFLNAEDIMDALESYAKREAIEGILNEKSNNVKEALKGVDTTILRADQRKLIDAMKVIDVKSLDSAEKQAYVRIGNNIIFNNNQTNGAEFFVATAKGQQSARDLAKNTAAMTKNKAWANILPSLGSRKAKKLLKSWASELQSIADTFRNAFGKEAMTVFYEAMGMVDLDLGFTQAARTLEEIQEKMSKFYDKLGKKYKGAATNQDGILSEGIVGYLIQSVPAKGEADSLAQRRALMQQGVANLRKSGDEDKIQMADRIQQLMQRLDGDTVDQMLSNLKREYPANYESLMWLKDELFPQYKDFLKFSDENFNDQANNYNTPNYLPIIYSNASPALDLLQGKKKYYDNLSASPKQSSYTIKRSDYTQLPMGSDGRTPKEISLNLRKNAYNSLSDQITRAYTNPARQRISSFLKTPEAEEALGGKANLDFFADRIERLMGSRERRGSFNEGFFGKAVDVLANLVRDVGTRIALAGSYQLIRQPADQVTVAVGATGRADLMAEHLAPRSIQTARPVLDLFSIGRRGDASSGYKYINQMEGAQSRLERYYTEGNWVKAKEAAKRFSDKFMTPLKVSDFTVAAATWMTFYRAHLAKNGIKFTTWEDAANLIKSDDVGHRRAAAYAENMTDIYQGSSDPTKMAVFAQKGKTGTENLLKSILVPFNSFGIQFRARVSSDITEIFTKSGDWKGKAIAVKDLSATIGGTVMFGLAKRFVLPAITYGGIKILYGIFGVDVEEPDEEKQKEEFEKKWRQLQGDIVSTMAVGGFGQMIEGHVIDGMNYIKYMIDTTNESESVLDDDGEIMSFNEYSKERAPFYRYRSFDNAPSLGMLDIGMDQARKAILNTKMVLTPEEMERFTPEEQRFLFVGLISDWLYLGGFNDADFARMWDKARRDMIKARKEEEKELQRIRSGR